VIEGGGRRASGGRGRGRPGPSRGAERRSVERGRKDRAEDGDAETEGRGTRSTKGREVLIPFRRSYPPTAYPFLQLCPSLVLTWAVVSAEKSRTDRLEGGAARKVPSPPAGSTARHAQPIAGPRVMPETNATPSTRFGRVRAEGGGVKPADGGGPSMTNQCRVAPTNLGPVTAGPMAGACAATHQQLPGRERATVSRPRRQGGC